MTISPKSVRFDSNIMWVSLDDGQILAVSLEQFPTLLNASLQQLQECEISPFGLHWDALDEDISIEGLLVGKQVSKPAAFIDGSALAAR